MKITINFFNFFFFKIWKKRRKSFCKLYSCSNLLLIKSGLRDFWHALKNNLFKMTVPNKAKFFFVTALFASVLLKQSFRIIAILPFSFMGSAGVQTRSLKKLRKFPLPINASMVTTIHANIYVALEQMNLHFCITQMMLQYELKNISCKYVIISYKTLMGNGWWSCPLTCEGRKS